LEFSARINKKGKLIIDNPSEMINFMSQFKDGMLIGQFTIKNKNPSKSMVGYYYKVVVPKFQKAFFNTGHRYTLEQVEEKIRDLSPVTKKESFTEEGMYNCSLVRFEDLDSFDQVLFLEHIKQIAAEEFSVFVEDPIFI